MTPTFCEQHSHSLALQPSLRTAGECSPAFAASLHRTRTRTCRDVRVRSGLRTLGPLRTRCAHLTSLDLTLLPTSCCTSCARSDTHVLLQNHPEEQGARGQAQGRPRGRHRPAHRVAGARGNPEPLYQVLRKEQVSGDSAKVYLKFMKDTKMPGADVGWAWSFDPAGKWHQIDQDGVVSHAMPWRCLLHASACMSLLLRTRTR